MKVNSMLLCIKKDTSKPPHGLHPCPVHTSTIWPNHHALAVTLQQQRYSLSVDDLGQAVPPDATLGAGAGLEDALLPCHQSPHRQTVLELLCRDTQQPSGPLQELCRPKVEIR